MNKNMNIAKLANAMGDLSDRKPGQTVSIIPHFQPDSLVALVGRLYDQLIHRLRESELMRSDYTTTHENFHYNTIVYVGEQLVVRQISHTGSDIQS